MSFNKSKKAKKKPAITKGQFKDAFARAEYVVTTHLYKVYKTTREKDGTTFSIIPKKHQGIDDFIVKLSVSRFEALDRLYDVWDKRINKR